jgi:hypothetical protein
MKYNTTVRFGAHVRYLLRELRFGVSTGNIMTTYIGHGTGEFKFLLLIYQTCFCALHEVVSGSGGIYLLFFLTTLLNMGEWSASRFASLPARPGIL